MMKHHHLFKTCLSAGLSKYRVQFSEFDRCRAVRDFFLDEASSSSTPRELAANALAELCGGDAGSMDRAVCTGVVQFLDREFGQSREDQSQMQRIIDLLHMISEPANRAQYLKWVNSWYP